MAPIGVANRVVLGLIPTAEESYTAACRSLNPSTSGTLHIHENVSSKEITEVDVLEKFHSKYNIGAVTCNRKLKPAWVVWAVNTAEKILHIFNEEKQPNTWQIHIKHIERVKSYAPHIDHLVLDLFLIPGTFS